MKKMVALLCVASVGASSLVACTPKPVSAEPVAEEFISEMESRNNEALAELVDLTWLNLVRRLGQLFGEFADVSGQVGLCMDGMACDFDGKRPVF
ncbi:hypothetical protein ACL1E8_02550, partial [Corynebacterium striatum]